LASHSPLALLPAGDESAMNLEAVGIFLDVVVLFPATCFCRGE
jgi:hypothetical protein